MLRDAPIADPQALADGATLKCDLATAHRDDILAYTPATTAFLQGTMDSVHDRLGLPRHAVWQD